MPVINPQLLVLGATSDKSFKLPLIASPVRAGFPSPADDYQALLGTRLLLPLLSLVYHTVLKLL